MTLSAHLVRDILRHLRVEPASPSPGFLQTLIDGYTTTVPWESVSRIARRSLHPTPEERVRFGAAFWRDALDRGLGGTCFESNGAFAALLRAVGFDVTFTINDINDCPLGHTALIVTLDGTRRLVDMGYPVYTAVPLDGPSRTASSRFHDYELHPAGTGRLRLERTRHPEPVCYTLIDVPVDDDDYEAATLADHGPAGLFLDRIVINKVVDGVQWRYSDADTPDAAESHPGGEKRIHPLGSDRAAALAFRFGLDLDVLRGVLAGQDGSKDPARASQ